MNTEIITTFINNNTKNFKTENVNLLNRINIIFFILTLCVLVSIEEIFGTIYIIVYFLLLQILNYIIVKNMLKKIYIIVSFMLSLILLLTAANTLYKYIVIDMMKYNISMLIYFILCEIMSIVIGIIYTCITIKYVKYNKCKKSKAYFVYISSFISGCFFLFLRLFVSKSAIDIQLIIVLTTLWLCCCSLTFYLGKVIIPTLHFMRKYKSKSLNQID